MLLKLSALQWWDWELLYSHVSIHNSQPRGCLQQLDITKGDLIKPKQTLQISISFSNVELTITAYYCILHQSQGYFLCRLQW